MTVFKCFLKMAKRNIPSIIIYFVIFLALIILFTQYGSETTTVDFNDTSLSVAVIDRDNSELSNSLKDYIGSKHKLVDLPDEKERLQDELFYRNVEYILIIPEDFESQMSANDIDQLDSVVENVKVPDSTTGMYVDMQIEQYLRTVKIYMQTGYNIKDAATLSQSDMEIETDIQFVNEKTTVRKSMYYYYQYLAYILLVLIINALGPILMNFNKTEIKQRNACSSLKLRALNAQLIVGTFTIAFLVFVLFTAVSILLYGTDMLTINGLLCIGNALILTIVTICIAYCVSMFIRSLSALNAITNVLGLGFSFLCGVFVPISLLNDKILMFSRFLPIYWYIDVNEYLAKTEITNTEALQPILQGYGIQLVFAVAFIAIALVISRQKARHPKTA